MKNGGFGYMNKIPKISLFGVQKSHPKCPKKQALKGTKKVPKMRRKRIISLLFLLVVLE